jgi:hypothetical protein
MCGARRVFEVLAEPASTWWLTPNKAGLKANGDHHAARFTCLVSHKTAARAPKFVGPWRGWGMQNVPPTSFYPDDVMAAVG